MGYLRFALLVSTLSSMGCGNLSGDTHEPRDREPPEEAGSPSALHSTFELSVTKRLTSDPEDVVLRVVARDDRSEVLQGIAVSFSSTMASDQIAPASGRTGTDGALQANLKGSEPGSRTVRASIGDWVLEATLLFEEEEEEEPLCRGPEVDLEGAASLLVGDFDGDGIDDVLSFPEASRGCLGSDNGLGCVSFHRGLGDGHFAPPREAAGFVTHMRPQWGIVGDFDGDGILDLGVSGISSPPYSGEAGPGIYFYQGLGDGEFIYDVSISTSQEHVEIKDLDGDGISDLMIREIGVDESLRSRFTRIKGLGREYPRSRLQFDTLESMEIEIQDGWNVCVGDVDGDGAADVVSYPGDMEGSVLLWLGDGRGAFSDSATLTDQRMIACRDLNGDGLLDLVFHAALESPGTRLEILWGGEPETRAAVDFDFGRGPQVVAFADLDDDGIADLLVQEHQEPQWLLLAIQGNADGSYGPKTLVSEPSPFRIAASGKFKQDSRLDLIYSSSTTLLHDWFDVLSFDGNPFPTFESRDECRLP